MVQTHLHQKNRGDSPLESRHPVTSNARYPRKAGIGVSVQEPFSTLKPAFLAAEEILRLLVTVLSNSTLATWLSGQTWADLTPLTFISAVSALAAEVLQVTPSSLNWALVTLAAALVAQQADPFSHFSASPANAGMLRRVMEAATNTADRSFIVSIGFEFCGRISPQEEAQ